MTIRKIDHDRAVHYSNLLAENEPLAVSEFAEAMQYIADTVGYDYEAAHSLMDTLMAAQLEALGFKDAVTIFDDQPRWYA